MVLMRLTQHLRARAVRKGACEVDPLRRLWAWFLLLHPSDCVLQNLTVFFLGVRKKISLKQINIKKKKKTSSFR